MTAHTDPATELCTYCPKLCRHVCPVAAADPREALVPQQKMQILGELRTGQRPWQAEEAEAIYGCTGCGLCTRYCAHEVPVGLTLAMGRGELSAHGGQSPVLEGLRERHAARDRAAAAALRARFSGRVAGPADKMVFLPGCDSVSSDDALADVAAALAVMEAVGAGVKLVDLDPAAGVLCGGQPLLAAGDHEALAEVARRQQSQLARYEVVVTTCPGCTRLMRDHYPALGAPLKPRIVHLTELLEPHAARLRELAKTALGPVHYHDPCHLGRGMGVYDAPRRVLAAAGADVQEFAWSRTESQCSGGGGLLPITMPETSRAMARRRLAEIDEGDGSPRQVVTACPTCKRSLSRVAGATTKVTDLATMLAGALGL